jgi:hypothetical protein
MVTANDKQIRSHQWASDYAPGVKLIRHDRRQPRRRDRHGRVRSGPPYEVACRGPQKEQNCAPRYVPARRIRSFPVNLGPGRGKTRRAELGKLWRPRCRSAALRKFAGGSRQGLNTSKRRTSSACRWVSVLSKTCCRWVRTVVYEIDNSSAICFRSAPRITCSATSASASVRR